MLGCIADDFTGATDLASVLSARGFRVRVEFGVLPHAPDADADGAGGQHADAVVIALKSRTVPPAEAIELSLAARERLVSLGADRLYFKYCSTFDSTPRGNIGPVADALLDAAGSPLTIVVPSYPDNGRTVVDGVLRVHGIPLAESAMRNHPLTPMLDSTVATLLAPQTRNRVRHVGLSTVRSGADAVRREFTELADEAGDARTLVVVDAETNADLTAIAVAAADLRVLTGSAGLALGMSPVSRGIGRGPARGRTGDPAAFAPASGERVILSGSASESTFAQVAAARRRMPSRRLATDASPEALDEIALWARAEWRRFPGEPVLIYAAAGPADLSAAGPRSREEDAARLERSFGALATALLEAGARQFLVAGGETSGRVVGDLGVATLDLGPGIAPGVVWGSGRSGSGIAITLALKSGNFGSEQMFRSAWEVLP